MNNKEKHIHYHSKKISYSTLKNIKSKYYRDYISENGNWLVALITEKIRPFTEDQINFVSQFKKVCQKKIKFDDFDKPIKALILWKGLNWVMDKSRTLIYKNFYKIKKLPGKGRIDRGAKNIGFLKNYKPPVKKSKKDKLDPEKIYLWQDQGFQTREGHKQLNKGRYSED